MPVTKRNRLLGEALEAAQAAKAIIEKAGAENREVTAAEEDEFSAKLRIVNEKRAAAQVAKKDEEVLAQARELADQIGGPVDEPTPDQWGRMSAGAARPRKNASPWAQKSARVIHNAMPGTDGQKAVISGTVRVSNPIGNGVTTLGRVPLTVLDLVSTEPASGNSFTFLRQTIRTNNAAPVADGATKPTSVYTITETEDRLRVIAHLSEPMPQRYFGDYAGLERFLADEMEFGLRAAVEAQLVSGAGTGENLQGILNTSGIIAQGAVTSDLVATMRKAVTQLQVNGGTSRAFVMHPSDAERFDLLREGAGTGQYLLGGPGSATDPNLWNIPRVASTSIAAGTALLGDWDYVSLVTRDNVEAAIDTSGANFTNNLATMRVEGRFGIAVTRPTAFVKITLPA